MSANQVYAKPEVLLGDLRGGLCSSGLCKQLRSVAADEIERLTQEASEARCIAAELTAARKFDGSEHWSRISAHWNRRCGEMQAERDRLRAALSGLKDLTCGECVPCERINAEIDKALSGEPKSPDNQ